MSEETPESAEAADGAEAANGEEPSMEDILASIRRILSEEEEEAEAQATAEAGAGIDMDLSAEPEPEPAPEPEPVPPPPPAPVPTPLADVLQLTPEMVTSEIISAPTVSAATDILADLARAILDRRDIAVDDAGRNMTLEGMVREMLKPLLREWLDRNLPYLIERLVKKKIDTMINRAEGLSD
jgi:cell pole-organizing protein PopZ